MFFVLQDPEDLAVTGTPHHKAIQQEGKHTHIQHLSGGGFHHMASMSAARITSSLRSHAHTSVGVGWRSRG